MLLYQALVVFPGSRPPVYCSPDHTVWEALPFPLFYIGEYVHLSN